ncbi:MAG: hypothetical protein JO118_00815 [Acetobacteraceae bacterium]|nr:hypothetical protein [Acetobacteraceae bacterium]
MKDFYDASAFEKLAVNLFHGWGYNFYRVENQVRADDLRVRSNVGLLLGQVRRSVEAAESAYRRAHLPPPSREKPRPDPQAVASAQLLEDLGRRLGRIEGQVRAQPVPENDRMTQRARAERETLLRLLDLDTRLVGQVEFLRQAVSGEAPAWLLDNLALVEASLASVDHLLRERQELLG